MTQGEYERSMKRMDRRIRRMRTANKLLPTLQSKIDAMRKLKRLERDRDNFMLSYYDRVPASCNTHTKVTATFNVTTPEGLLVEKELTMSQPEFSKLECNALQNKDFIFKGTMQLWREFKLLKLVNEYGQIAYDIT